ncbi:hypothetical protein K493DRAFT_299104 [Basidiobolus meristosporus CBS 931.73]|uniref:G-protein coupled receptors family 1 profile domain-containing protein n=1 Tax=Basidiobolus meristosporus CBS 931.73 TaxID=1314790 RepID=A0A1Y1YPK1_9FUNG|nr:hypothetical protein K493DRAFT_299104 [Basidiobolus meristosporus CBS 931.73]|eukprot:ORX99905.1 hypothetical protein K493DRAFT_299104 [Basidiobolus meristosporus CBS 931.73]
MGPPVTITAPLHLLFESNITMSLTAMCTVVFINNLYHSIRMLPNNQKLIYYLCFIQALFGAFTNIIAVVFFFYFDLLCGPRIYLAATLNLFATTCIEIILLLKAYYGSDRSKIIFGIGKINMLTGMLVVIFELVLNAYFSVLFLSSMYRQWKFVKTRLYAALLKDGTIYSFATAFTSVAMIILASAGVLGDNSPILFNVSWAVASKLIVEQLINTHKLKRDGVTNDKITTKRTNNTGATSTERSGSTNPEFSFSDGQKKDEFTIKVVTRD